MQEPHLTVAAHLLLWAFPLALIILVAADVIRGARSGGTRP
jgi:hypothetical protein